MEQAVREVDAYLDHVGELGGLKEAAGDELPWYETGPADVRLKVAEKRGIERGQRIRDHDGWAALRAEIERMDRARNGQRPVRA